MDGSGGVIGLGGMVGVSTIERWVVDCVGVNGKGGGDGLVATLCLFGPVDFIMSDYIWTRVVDSLCGGEGGRWEG